jgi:hypothetical protein
MAGMTDREVLKLVKKYIGIDAGNLMEFSYNSLAEFYTEIGVDRDLDSYTGTKRARFVAILNEADPREQAKIVRGVLERIEPNPERLSTRTQELHDELLALAERLEGACPVRSKKPAITSEVVERAINDAERLLETEGATSAVDRLHTVLHGYLRAVCESEGIEYTKNMLMSGLFGLIRNRHPAFAAVGPREREINQILRSMSGIMDAMNPIRNESSEAHPNKDLLDPPEASLVINSARTILHYLDMKIRAVNIGDRCRPLNLPPSSRVRR